MAGGPKRFLVVDDERHVVRLLQVNLERSGCHVTVAHGGQEAIDTLSQQSFDRVIVDYDMPQVNGYQVLEFIRTNERLKGIWVLLMTKISDDREAIMGLPPQSRFVWRKAIQSIGLDGLIGPVGDDQQMAHLRRSTISENL